MEAIKRVAILSKPGALTGESVVRDLLAWLAARDIDVRYDDQTAEYAGRKDGVPREHLADEAQLMIVLGGDGTLLSAARAMGAHQVPLFAVNLGNLGFLTAISVGEIFEELDRALRGEHRIGPRRMLHCEVFRDEQKIHEWEALNDIVVTKARIARMIDVDCKVDNHFVCDYKVDGLIVATPTGSTAYSLSAGGPIMFPTVAALCITPICPHTLTNRPVIVPDSSNIQLLNRAADDDAYLTIDGQIGIPLKHDDLIVCHNSAYSVQLIRPPRMLYFDVLREKLKWGKR